MDEPTLRTNPLEEKFVRARIQGPWDSDGPWRGSPGTSRPRKTGRLGAPVRMLRELTPTRSRTSIWQAYAAAVLTLCLLVGVGRILWHSRDDLVAAPFEATRIALEDTAPAKAPKAQPRTLAATTEPELITAEIDGATIQVATFRARENAERLVEKLRETRGQAHLRNLGGDLYQVAIGPMDRRTAELMAEAIQAETELTPLIVDSTILQIRIAAR